MTLFLCPVSRLGVGWSGVESTQALGPKWCRFNSWFCSFSVVCPWASHLILLNLCSYIKEGWYWHLPGADQKVTILFPWAVRQQNTQKSSALALYSFKKGQAILKKNSNNSQFKVVRYEHHPTQPKGFSTDWNCWKKSHWKEHPGLLFWYSLLRVKMPFEPVFPLLVTYS